MILKDFKVHPDLSRVKKAEECFKQAREKASFSVKPKHAAGIVRSLSISDRPAAPPLLLPAHFQTVPRPALNFFFFSAESQTGPEDLKQTMENGDQPVALAACLNNPTTIHQEF